MPEVPGLRQARDAGCGEGMKLYSWSEAPPRVEPVNAHTVAAYK